MIWAFIKNRLRKEGTTPNFYHRLRCGCFGKNWRGALTSITFLFIWSMATLGDSGRSNLRAKHPGENRARLFGFQRSEGCTDWSTSEMKCRAQHRGADSSGQELAVQMRLKGKGHSFKDRNVKVWAREKDLLEQPSVNRGGVWSQIIRPKDLLI